MSPTRAQFADDVMRLAAGTVTDNWDSWCYHPQDPGYWQQRGAQWLEAYRYLWPDLQQSREALEDDYSRRWLDDLMLFRVLGPHHKRLPLNNPTYWECRRQAEAAVVESGVAYRGHFKLDRLRWGDLEFVGHPASLLGLCGLRQYQYGGEATIAPERGDIVLDLGGCWGDSGLVFAQNVGDQGRVIVSEFVESNLTLARANFALNPELQQRITLVTRPVSERTGTAMYYSDRGPGSRFLPNSIGATGVTQTISVDDLVSQLGLPRVDFIKMDIEGAERDALQGAAATIRQHKPKLAISAYHCQDDMVLLTRLIKTLHPEYKLYLDHYTLFDDETVLYAI